jgi:two-component system response regulator
MASQKILIVDDGKAIRMQVREMLPKGSFDVLEAQDGLEGLNLIRQERPNFVLLDFFMPRMNGWEVLQQIQSQPELQSIPLVVMSGRKEEVIEKVPDLFQYFEFIEKPFDQKALITAIKSSMLKAKARQPAAATPAKPIESKPASSGSDAAEIQALKAQIQALNSRTVKMQAEFEAMKKQMAQMMAFIKQKLK